MDLDKHLYALKENRIFTYKKTNKFYLQCFNWER